MSLNLFASIFTSKMFLFIWHVHLNGQCIYIITYTPHDVCVTVHGVAIIRTFTTSLHTPFTSVPELGASSRPFARGTKQPYSYTGSDDSDLVVSVYKANKTTVISKNNLPSEKKRKKAKVITGLWWLLKVYFTQQLKHLPRVVSTHEDSFGFIGWSFEWAVIMFLLPHSTAEVLTCWCLAGIIFATCKILACCDLLTCTEQLRLTGRHQCQIVNQINGQIESLSWMES